MVFDWVLREANGAAHWFATWSLLNKLASYFVLGFAPQFFSVIHMVSAISIKSS